MANDIRQHYELEPLPRALKQHRLTTVRLIGELNNRYTQALLLATMAGKPVNTDSAVLVLHELLQFVGSDEWLLIGEFAGQLAEESPTSSVLPAIEFAQA